jgi:FkbM family methyltransferase
MSKILPSSSDPDEIEDFLWEGFSHTGKVAYDVGSNAGQLFHRIQKIALEIHGFEPAIESYEYLEHHFGHRTGFFMNNLAVSSFDGPIRLAETSRIETGQLVTAGTEGMDWSQEAAEAPLRTVQATTLDRYARETGRWPDFLKIDVEGHEWEVIKGAVGVIAIQHPEMLIEIHSEKLGEQISDFLQKMKYRLDTVRHPHYDVGSTLWKSHFWLKAFPTD